MTIKEKQAMVLLAASLSHRKTRLALDHFQSASVAIEALKISNNGSCDESLDNCIVLGETGFPEQLAQIEDCPLVLYYKGNIDLLSGKYNRIALVGTRRPSEYGRRVAQKFALEAVGLGLVTVSGMAYGIDSDIHNFTLDDFGYTIAVLGTGINKIYPSGNNYLADRIIDNNGLIISEFNNVNSYDKWVFPRRNRIIAGLADNTVVIEAGLKSGALLTAELAADYNRNVFVTPGSIFNPNSLGCNNAIKELKAELITSVYDIYPDKTMHNSVGASDIDGLSKLPIAEALSLMGNSEIN